MKEKTRSFFLNNVEIFEEFIEYLWKKPIKIVERKIYPQGKDFIIDFIINDLEMIRLKGQVEQKGEDVTVRLKYTSYCNQDFNHYGACLFLSFCYECPEELELCNQYGLYKKEDIKDLELSSDINQIYVEQKNKNLLGDNQIFIFNMKRIKEHCRDKALDQILQDFDKAIKNVYYSKS